jgi:hypothetical protein
MLHEKRAGVGVRKGQRGALQDSKPLAPYKIFLAPYININKINLKSEGIKKGFNRVYKNYKINIKLFFSTNNL